MDEIVELVNFVKEGGVASYMVVLVAIGCVAISFER